MSAKRVLLPLIAIATYSASWFVPVHRGGARIGAGELPGWQAFRLCLSTALEIPTASLTRLPVALILTANALTNFWFVIAAFLLLRRPAGPRPLVKWGLLVSVVLNLFWFVLGSDRGDLLPGYYLWVASFAMLTVAAFNPGADKASS
jgi:hypothetical protein